MDIIQPPKIPPVVVTRAFAEYEQATKKVQERENLIFGVGVAAAVFVAQLAVELANLMNNEYLAVSLIGLFILALAMGWFWAAVSGRKLKQAAKNAKREFDRLNYEWIMQNVDLNQELQQANEEQEIIQKYHEQYQQYQAKLLANKQKKSSR